MPRRGLVTGLVVSAALAGAAILWPRGEEPADRASTLACLTEGALVAVTGTTTTIVTIDPSALVPNASAMAGMGAGGLGGRTEEMVRERWTLALRGIGRDPRGRTIVAVRLTDLDVRLGDEAQRMETLPSPALIALDDRCGIVDHGRLDDAPLGTARRLQALLAELHFALPRPTDDPGSYSVAGEDITGVSEVRFEQTDRGLAGETVRYTRVHAVGPDGRPAEVRVHRGTVDVATPGSAWFARLERDRAVGYPGANGEAARIRVQVSARTRAGADPVQVPESGWIWGSLLPRRDVAFGMAFGSAATAPPPSAPYDEGTLDMFVDIFRLGLPSAGGDYAARVTSLADWLAAHPEAAGPLLARLVSGELDDVFGARSAAFLALGMADVPGTRAALLAVIDDPDAGMGYRLHAAVALSSARVPEPGLVSALEGWIDDPELDTFGRGSAYLALGALAGSRGDDHPELADRIADRIEADLTADDATAESLAFALDAASNTGDGSLGPAVSAILRENDDANLQAMAAEALQSMPPEVAGPPLAAAIVGDSDVVRASAMRSLARAHRSGPLPPGVVDRVVQVADEAREPVAWQGAVGFLGAGARKGDEDAQVALRALWDAELARRPLDPERLRALGFHVGPEMPLAE